MAQGREDARRPPALHSNFHASGAARRLARQVLFGGRGRYGCETRSTRARVASALALRFALSSPSLSRSRQSDLNRRPVLYESTALPAELCRRNRVSSDESYLAPPSKQGPRGEWRATLPAISGLSSVPWSFFAWSRRGASGSMAGQSAGRTNPGGSRCSARGPGTIGPSCNRSSSILART